MKLLKLLSRLVYASPVLSTAGDSYLWLSVVRTEVRLKWNF